MTTTLPATHAYEPTHNHGTHDLAGYVVARTDWRNGAENLTVTDVSEIAGAGNYVRALDIARELRNSAVEGTYYVIHSVYTDGCRAY